MSLMNKEAGAVFTIMVACLALEAIIKDQVEQLNTIRVALKNGIGYRLRSREEPESARMCVKICKYGS